MEPDAEALVPQEQGSLTPDQQTLLLATRDWVARTALDVKSSASHEPRHTKLGDEFPGMLWITIRPRKRAGVRRKPRYSHACIQFGMSSDGILIGGWQGAHYVWEFPENEAFRVSVPPVAIGEAIAQAFEWAERELSTAGSSP